MVAVQPLPSDDDRDRLDPDSTDADDHPDPITLTQPQHDEQGRLRWGSPPSLDRR